MAPAPSAAVALEALHGHWQPRNAVAPAIRQMVADGVGRSERQARVRQWIVRYLRATHQYAAGHALDVTRDPVSGQARLELRCGDGTHDHVALRNLSNCPFSKDEVAPGLIDYVISCWCWEGPGAHPTPPGPDASPSRRPSADSVASSPQAATCVSSVSDMTLPLLGDSTGGRQSVLQQARRASALTAPSPARGAGSASEGTLPLARSYGRADSWPRVGADHGNPLSGTVGGQRRGAKTLQEWPRADARAAPDCTGQQGWEARDVLDRWWPVQVAGRNADGTFRCHVDDGTETDGVKGKYWPLVHPANMRRVSKTDAEARSTPPRRYQRLPEHLRASNRRWSCGPPPSEADPAAGGRGSTPAGPCPPRTVDEDIPSRPSAPPKPPQQPLSTPPASRGEAAARRKQLAENLQRFGLLQHHVPADGNCQFRALAWHLFNGDHERHSECRGDVVRQLTKQRSLYESFVLTPPEGEGWERFLRRIAIDGAWGDHLTLQAASDCYCVIINVVTSRVCTGDDIAPAASARGGWLHRVFPHDSRGREVHSDKEIWVSFLEEQLAEHYNPVSAAPVRCTGPRRASAHSVSSGDAPALRP